MFCLVRYETNLRATLRLEELNITDEISLLVLSATVIYGGVKTFSDESEFNQTKHPSFYPRVNKISQITL